MASNKHTINNKPLLGASHPGAVFLIGFMGCGKTYWGKQLGERLGVPFYDLDDRIEQSEGRTINEIFETEGEEYFREKEKEALMLFTETHHSFVMATGGGTPCFLNNIDYMNRKGTTIWIHCSVECLQKRLSGEKEKRPLIKNLDDEALKAYIIRKAGDRKIFYQQADVVVDEDGLTLESFYAKIFQTEINE